MSTIFTPTLAHDGYAVRRDGMLTANAFALGYTHSLAGVTIWQTAPGSAFAVHAPHGGTQWGLSRAKAIRLFKALTAKRQTRYQASDQALMYGESYADYIQESITRHVALGHYTRAHALAMTLGDCLAGNDGD